MWDVVSVYTRDVRRRYVVRGCVARMCDAVTVYTRDVRCTYAVRGCETLWLFTRCEDVYRECGALGLFPPYLRGGWAVRRCVAKMYSGLFSYKWGESHKARAKCARYWLQVTWSKNSKAQRSLRYNKHALINEKNRYNRENLCWEKNQTRIFISIYFIVNYLNKLYMRRKRG